MIAVTKARARRKRPAPIREAIRGDWIVQIQPGYWIAQQSRWPGTCTDSAGARHFPTEQAARNSLAGLRRSWQMPMAEARVYQPAEARK